MNIGKEQQLSLVTEVKLLIDENRESAEVLERACSIARVVFGILSTIDGDDHSVGFNLQDYAYNSFQASQGDAGASAWIDENVKRLNESIELKYSSDDNSSTI